MRVLSDPDTRDHCVGEFRRHDTVLDEKKGESRVWSTAKNLTGIHAAHAVEPRFTASNFVEVKLEQSPGSFGV